VKKLEQAICNIYDAGVWLRVEHYHLDCYITSGEPYGPAEPAPVRLGRPFRPLV
jgi:hypothetical protein